MSSPSLSPCLLLSWLALCLELLSHSFGWSPHGARTFVQCSMLCALCMYGGWIQLLCCLNQLACTPSPVWLCGNVCGACMRSFKHHLHAAIHNSNHPNLVLCVLLMRHCGTWASWRCAGVCCFHVLLKLTPGVRYCLGPRAGRSTCCWCGRSWLIVVVALAAMRHLWHTCSTMQPAPASPSMASHEIIQAQAGSMVTVSMHARHSPGGAFELKQARHAMQAVPGHVCVAYIHEVTHFSAHSPHCA